MATPLSGTITVTTAGTKVALPSARRKCLWLYLRAAEGNTGIVYFGDTSVSASNGLPLHAGTDGVNVDVTVPYYVAGGIKLSDLYMDAASNGDKAHFTAVLE